MEAASEKQASNIVLLDMRESCAFSEYFVISSGESDRQINAIEDEIEKALRAAGVKPLHREGTAESGWILLDFGSVIVHIFTPEERDFYQLEQLWDKTTTVVKIL